MIDDGRMWAALGIAGVVGAGLLSQSSRGSRCACGGAQGLGSANCGCGQGSLAKVDNDGVADAWSRNRPAESGAMRTDGSTLWSYSTILGETFTEDGKIVYAHPERSSHTTMVHLTIAKRYADQVVERREDAEPVRGIAGLRPAPFGALVPRPRQPHEATEQEQEWEEKGPWHTKSDWRTGTVFIENAETGQQKQIGSTSGRNSAKVWGKATKEAAARNKKAVNDAERKAEKARMKAMGR